MGYRLNIQDKNNKYYNTKLYGYIDENKLESYKYLQQIGKIGEDMFWVDGIYNKIKLNGHEFKKFAKYYANDLINYSEFKHDNWLDEDNIPLLLNSKEDKIIYWS